MSKGKRKSFSEKHKPDIAERQRQKDKIQYQKYGHVNGRRYYKITDAAPPPKDPGALWGTMWFISTPWGTTNVFPHVQCEAEYKWLRPKDITLLLLQGKRVDEDTPQDDL